MCSKTFGILVLHLLLGKPNSSSLLLLVEQSEGQHRPSPSASLRYGKSPYTSSSDWVPT
jgi:hypothetical protein